MRGTQGTIKKVLGNVGVTLTQEKAFWAKGGKLKEEPWASPGDPMEADPSRLQRERTCRHKDSFGIWRAEALSVAKPGTHSLQAQSMGRTVACQGVHNEVLGKQLGTGNLERECGGNEAKLFLRKLG